MATKKTVNLDHAKVLVKAIDEMCAADAIYKSCQAYPFRLFASGIIHSPEVQAAVSALRGDDDGDHDPSGQAES